MKNWIVAALMVIAILGGAGAGYFVGVTYNQTSINTKSLTTMATTNITTSPRLVEDYGPILSLDQARQVISSNFTLPAYLPDELALQGQIRGHPANSSSIAEVALIYSSPTLPRLFDWTTGNMIILIMRDGSTYYPPPSVGGPVVFDNATVWGQPAWGYSPQEYAPGMGSLMWWSEGVHYAIFADLPFSTMVQIAQTMSS